MCSRYFSAVAHLSRYPTALRNVLRQVTGLRELCRSKLDSSDKVHVHIHNVYFECVFVALLLSLTCGKFVREY